MPWFDGRETVLAGSMLAALIWVAPAVPAAAQQKAAPPDFSSNQFGWVGLNGNGPSRAGGHGGKAGTTLSMIRRIGSFPTAPRRSRPIGSRISAIRT